NGAVGRIDYREHRTTSYPNSDPYLVLGAEKHDYPGSRYYSGLLDDLRFSRVVRYTTPFARPTAPHTIDADTVALYRFDEGSGVRIGDSAPGGVNTGELKPRPGGAAQHWSTDTPFSNTAPTSTIAPTATSTNTLTAIATTSPTATGANTPTAIATTSPTATGTNTPTAIATTSPTATSTNTPTAIATTLPTATSTTSPTATYTIVPTASQTPSVTPSIGSVVPTPHIRVYVPLITYSRITLSIQQ
ncbi:MAG: LamG domain-containing protein, partial [Chloroflexus sp.]|nr:LamG domain-containing protein [Chloroflexus sp.]